MVGILLRLPLKFDVRSVADFYPIARVSPKSFKSQIYAGVDIDIPGEYIDLFVMAMGERILLAQSLGFSNGYPK